MYKVDLKIGKSKRTLFLVGDDIEEQEVSIIGDALTDYLKGHIVINKVTALKESHIDKIMSEADPELQRLMIVENEAILIDEACRLREQLSIIKSICGSI